MSESDPRTIASFRIVEELGAVPEGRAYRTVDTRSGDTVLLKILEPSADPSDKSWQVSLQRTRRLGRMSHPSLPILYQIGMSPEGPFVAFSPPSGIPLRQFVSQGGRVDRKRLVDWSSQLLGLLAEAHAEGLLHGHLGVDSIFVGEDGELFLTGFGLTRLLPDTPEVQPPEQGSGGQLTPSSDLYSLAALMKRLGAAVEMGGASSEPLVNDDPLLQVLHRATAQDPRDRFADAVDMDRALRGAASEGTARPAAAPPLPAPEQEMSILPGTDPALSTVRIDPGMLNSELAKLQAAAPTPAAALLFFQNERARPVATADAPQPKEALPAPAEPAALPATEEDPILQVARLLAQQEGESLFGAAEMSPEEQALMTRLQQDLADMDFPPEDPLGTRQAHSVFGENPLLGPGNPLLDAKIRERLLASAIARLGPQMALAHLQEETEKLRRKEVSRAEWYEHVAACQEFCNHVVSGLLFEHVQQVKTHPKHLVLFDTGSTAVAGAAQGPLAAFLETSLESSGFLLVGRSSRSGNREVNRELSRQRVESVQRFLGEQAVNSSRIRSIWLGYEPPQLSAELARVYGLDDTPPAEALNQSVLVVAFDEPSTRVPLGGAQGVGG